MSSRPTKHAADGTNCSALPNNSSRRHPDAEIARLAERQHGVITSGQLRGLGVGRSAVCERVVSGRLHPAFPGVFAVGRARLDRDGWFLAAVLSCGQGSVVSHRSAAMHWGLIDGSPSPVDLTAPHRRGRSPRGIRAHRDGKFAAEDRAEVRGVPCTAVPRTLLDLAAVVPVRVLRRAISQAEVLGVLDFDDLRRLVRRSKGRRGVARLRAELNRLHPDTRRTRSGTEVEFLDMCRRAGLPRPEVNVKLQVGGQRIEPDFLWRDAGLIVETDGGPYHDTRSAFQRDRRNDQLLQHAGWTVIRCTSEQLEHEPRRLAAIIFDLLNRAGVPADGTNCSALPNNSSRRPPG